MNKFLIIGAIAAACGVAWAGTQEDDLLSLAKSGLDEQVLISYIDAAKGPYHLTPDQIVQLKDLGASSKVISEALRHGISQAGTGPVQEAALATGLEPAARQPSEPTINSPESPAVTPAESMSIAPAAPTAPTPEAVTPVAPQPEEIAPAAPASEAANPSESSAVAPAPGAPPVEAVAPAPGDQNISFFYQALYPYGTWIAINGQWCWKPNAATIDLSWTPYFTNGYWSCTDWGWFWVSNYSWGWAPFHYGRWFRHPGYGWVWAPGTDWGPAWVSFRSCDGYFGWAPLPPAAYFDAHRGFFFNGHIAVGAVDFGLTLGDYRFVPAENFADRDVWTHVVPAGQARLFFGRTIVMRDNYRIGTDRVINRGPSLELVTRYAGHEIARFSIMQNEVRPGERIHGIVRANGNLFVYKPMISREAPASPLEIGRRYDRAQVGGGRRYDQGGQNGAYQQGNRGHRQDNADDRDRDRH